MQALAGLFFSLTCGFLVALIAFILPDLFNSNYGYNISLGNLLFFIKIISCITSLFIFQIFIWYLYSNYSYISYKKRFKLILMLCFGVGYFFTGLFWLNDAMYLHGGLPLVLSLLACLLFALYNSLFFVLSIFISPNIIFIPFSFVICEWLRGNLFTGFPWLNLGYSLIDSPFAFFAQYFGVYGVSFFGLLFISLLNIFIQFLYKQNFKLKYLAICLMILFCVILFYGYKNLSKTSFDKYDNSINIRIIQGAINQNRKFSKADILKDIDLHLDLMLNNNFSNFIPDLIVTPETVFPILMDDLPDNVYTKMLEYSRRYSTSILFGAASTLNKQYTNSLFFISNNKQDSIKTYYKYHLVPFGEFIPYGFQWFVTNLVMPMGDFARGELVQDNFIFYKNNQKLRFSANICYELLFGEELAVVNNINNPNFFVNSTNLAWFGSSGLVQFLNIARMRSLELRKSIVISNNSGVSAVILPNGSVNSWLDIGERGVLNINLPLYNNSPTFYTKYGNLPILIIIFFGFICLLYYNI